jgi:GAF domain-containing protein
VSEDRLRAAVAAAVLGADDDFRALLQSIVETARAIFGAEAASVFLHDPQTDELVFEAVAGRGEEHLVGRRFPANSGIAGWTLMTRQPIVLEDVENDPRFARELAEATGYVPKGLMSAPLLHEDRVLGVLQVLDRPLRPGFSLQEMDLLSLFATQAGIGLDLLVRARHAKALLETGESEVAVVAELASVLAAAPPETRAAGLRLFAALQQLLPHE